MTWGGRPTGARVQGVVVVAVALVAALAGCGDDGTVTASEGPGPTAGIEAWGPATQLPEGWTMFAPPLEGLDLRDDGAGLVADVVVEPVRLADGSCAGEAGGWLVDEGNDEVVWAELRAAVPDVSVDEALVGPADEFGACDPVSATVDLGGSAPIADRDVMVSGARWVPGVDGAYALCELPGCDPATGDGPALATCGDGSALVEDVRTLGDVGRHAGIVESRCRDGWAMVEVDIGSDACPPADGGPNPCAGLRVDRLFLRAGVPHWEVVGRTREAGCGGVASLEPDYPLDLCEDRRALPSPGGSTTTTAP